MVNKDRNEMRVKINLLILFLVAGLLGCSPDNSTPNEDAASEVAMATTTATSRPNILFVVADDIGFTDLGAFGSEISTPNLDELAFGGLRLNNLHAAPACRTTRLMLMSSAGTVAANHPLP